MAPPLRIIVPIDYPARGVVVLRDLTMSLAVDQLYTQFDKRLAVNSESNTIPQVLHAWNIASEYVFKSNYAARCVARA